VQRFNGVVWATPFGLLGQCGIFMHQHSTSGMRRRRIIKNKKVISPGKGHERFNIAKARGAQGDSQNYEAQLTKDTNRVGKRGENQPPNIC
jgi:hypothetical protein